MDPLLILRRLVLVVAILFTPVRADAGGMMILGAGGGAGGGGGGGACSQATTALAALSGLTAPQIAAYTSLICGLVFTGDWGHLDALWTATTSFANSEVNLANPGTYNLTPTGVSALQSPAGWLGDGVSSFLDTGILFNSGSLHFVQNSASMGACILNSRTGQQHWAALGWDNAGAYTYIAPLDAGSLFGFDLNGESFLSSAATNARGSWIVLRQNGSTVRAYHNATAVPGSPFSDATTNSLSTAQHIVLLAQNDHGTKTAFSADTLGYAFFGDGGINASNVYNILHAFMTDASIGATGC